MSKLEKDFQSSLIKELRQLFPGCVILKNDPTHNQGIPDLTVLYLESWATLEVKKNKEEATLSYKHNTPPNQGWYVDMLNEMSFSAYIYPENKEEVLRELQQAFGVSR